MRLVFFDTLSLEFARTAPREHSVVFVCAHDDGVRVILNVYFIIFSFVLTYTNSFIFTTFCWPSLSESKKKDNAEADLLHIHWQFLGCWKIDFAA